MGSVGVVGDVDLGGLDRVDPPPMVDQTWPISIVQDVEESRVENGVELLVERLQLKGVPDEEPGRYAPLACFALGGGDGRPGQVDPGGLQIRGRLP